VPRDPEPLLRLLDELRMHRWTELSDLVHSGGAFNDAEKQYLSCLCLNSSTGTFNRNDEFRVFPYPAKEQGQLDGACKQATSLCRP
jgi:hypothetical protein